MLAEQRMVMDEMIDTHRLETDHNLNEIDELHAALEHHVRESETHRTAAIKMFEELEAARTEMVAAKAETVKVRASAKEEEEKREKAISLLRAVRGKLQNVEKAKLEADEARDSARSVVKTTQEMLEAEKARFETELGGVKRAHEEHHASLLVAHARELDTLREAHVKEFGSHKSAFENELANAKTAHQGEIDSLTSRASQLERSLQDLTQEKLTLSDAHSVLQTELEAGRAQLVQVTEQMTKHVGEVSSLQKRCAELEKQLTDHTERATAQEQASQKSLVDATTGHETKQRELLDRIAELEKAQEAARESVERDLRERDEELKRLQLVLEEKEGEREKLDKASRDSIERAEVAEKETEMLKAKLAELEANLSTPRPDSEAQTEMTKAAVVSDAPLFPLIVCLMRPC